MYILRKRKNTKAFTLIEMLLYIGVAGMVLSSLVAFGWNMMGIGAKSGTHADVVSNERLVAEKLSFFIREATDIDATNSDFGVNVATTTGSKITLHAVAPNDPIVFDVSGGVLRVTQGTAAPVALTSSNVSVSSLVFTNFSSADGKAKNIGFEIQLATISASNRSEYASASALRSSAELRSNSSSGTASVVSIWGATVPGVVDSADTPSVTLGVKFRSSVAGKITGIRFYKATTNTGTHTGKLWSLAGAELGSVTFSGETASGWQEASFASPISIAANTVYVASYHAPNGHYSDGIGYFSASGYANSPLYALQDGESGANGVYVYESGASHTFPTLTYQSTNYWVDVLFVAN